MGVYASLNGGPGSDDAPAQCGREPRAHGGGARGAAGSPAHRLSGPLARRGDDRPAVAAAGAPARRCDRDRRAGARNRRHHRRLRPGPVRRPKARVYRRGPCRLARRRSAACSRRPSPPWNGCGADRARISAALGPTIRQPSYEVGPEFVARFTSADANNERFFLPSPRPGACPLRSSRLYRRPPRRCRHPDRGPRHLHLRRYGAVFQLPTFDSPQRARLRAPRHAIALAR